MNHRLPSMRIGMIAPEFPPDIGGMHTLAQGFAETLGARHDVTVYAPKGQPLVAGAYRQKAIFANRLPADFASLVDEPIDVWLGTNAGLLPLLAKLTGPVFCYVHGKDFLTPWIAYGPWWLDSILRPHAPTFRKAIRRRALAAHRKSATHFFTNSRQTAALAMERLGIESGDISVCPPGVDDCYFQPRSQRDGSRLRLITVSRLTRFTRRKNIDGVLRAVAALRGEIPLEYIVVGDGDDRERLQLLATNLGIADLVTFRGALSRDDLCRAYADADLFVLASKASRLDFEGFGIVYIEACASGLPVLCSSEGGATDAVEDGNNGILVKDSSPATIADGIRRFVRTRADFPEETVRAWAERFRWSTVTERLEATILRHLT